MKNKYLLSLLAALGFSGCGNNNEIWDEPCYYGHYNKQSSTK